MTLLTEVMNRPLDPGYAAAAATRRAAGRARRGPVTIAVPLLIAVLCGGLVVTAVRELRRPQPAVVKAQAALVQQVDARNAANDRLQKSNERLRAWIAATQQAALTNEGSTQLAQESRTLGVLTGEVEVTGPGLLISLNDAASASPSSASDPRATGNADQGRVLDRDLQIVVNGLWAAGAEAISINGQRLTGLSAIRSAGEAILVDFRPLVPPYVIQAIGDPSGLQSGFATDMAGPYLQSLQSNYGIRASIQAEHSLDVPAAGSLSLHYAHVAGTGGGAVAATGAASPAASVSPEVSK